MGRPIVIDARGPATIRWLSLRRTEPERVGSEDDWVWAFRRRAAFFLTSVIAEGARGVLPCTLLVEGLLCRSTCMFIAERLPFVIHVDQKFEGEPFDAAPFSHRRYTRSQPMPFGPVKSSVVPEPVAQASTTVVKTAEQSPERRDNDVVREEHQAVSAVRVVDAESHVAGEDSVSAVGPAYTPREWPAPHSDKPSALRATTFGLAAPYVRLTLGLVLVACLAIVGFRTWHRLAISGASMWRKTVALVVGGAVVLAGGWLAVVASGVSQADDERLSGEPLELVWRPFTSAALRQAHARGDHVLVEFTSPSCGTCRHNRRRVLHDRGIAAELVSKDVLLLSADLALADGGADSLLGQLGGHEPPVIALFSGEEPYRPVVACGAISRLECAQVLEQLPVR